MAFDITSLAKSLLEKKTYTHGEGYTYHLVAPTFRQRTEGKFWGDLQGQVQRSMRRRFELCRSGNATST